MPNSAEMDHGIGEKPAKGVLGGWGAQGARERTALRQQDPASHLNFQSLFSLQPPKL